MPAISWTKLAAQPDGGKPVQLKAGDYAVKQNASMRQVIDLLSEGKTMTYRVTIPEGLTSHQIVERLKADANLAGEIEARAARGLAAARDLHHRARHAAARPSSTACRPKPAR